MFDSLDGRPYYTAKRDVFVAISLQLTTSDNKFVMGQMVYGWVRLFIFQMNRGTI